MSIAAIIAEYNPFHTGHAYQIEETRRLSGCDHVLVIMSGNYVQRGEPAIMDKYLRTKLALLGGADVIIEMPVYISTASSIDFAEGCVTILNHLGCVDYLSFGSEEGTLDILKKAADIFLTEPDAYRLTFKSCLAEGKSYPKARKLAYEAYTGEKADFLDSPNNILGISYLMALAKTKSSIKPLTLKRQGAYHDPSTEGRFSSATAMRKALSEAHEDFPENLVNYLPEGSYPILSENFHKTYPLDMDPFWPILKYKLLTESDFTKYFDLPQALSNRIEKQAFSARNYEELCSLLKTEGFTRSRINRCLLHVLLDLKESDISYYKEHGYTSYIRILGVKKAAKGLISLLSRRADLPVICSYTHQTVAYTDEFNVFFKKQKNMEIKCANLYESLKCSLYQNTTPVHEMSHKFLVI